MKQANLTNWVQKDNPNAKNQKENQKGRANHSCTLSSENFKEF